MPDSFISGIGTTKVEGKFQRRGQLQRPGADGSAIYHCRKNRQERSASDRHEGGNKHPAVTGEAYRTRKETTNDSARDTYGQIHPHPVAFSFEAFAGKPSGRESHENPNYNLHVFSSAENLRREKRERLGACPLQKSQRASANDGLVR
jgi:hypothetical protein